jgi:hypothetical protein
MFWAGFLGDKTNLWLARRRGGIHLPEDTLVILIFPTVVSMIGIVVYALGAAKPESYTSWSIIMGMSTQTGALKGRKDLSQLTFLTRLDTVPIRIHRVHHHVDTLCRRSLPK